MKLDFSELSALLAKDAVVTYKMRHQLFFSPMGNQITVWHKPGAAMLLDHSLHIYGDESVLESFLADLEPGRTYSFFCVAARYMPLLERHFEGIKREEDCTAYTIAKEDFSLHQAGVLDNLTSADAELVNEHWTYKFEGSLDFFRHIIREYPSSAIRVDGKLAGWAVCYDCTDDMVNLGSLRVLDEYRKQGLGKLLATDLVQKVLDTGKTPMVHILDDNIPSKTLSMSLGFKPYPTKIFWGSGVKN